MAVRELDLPWALEVTGRKAGERRRLLRWYGGLLLAALVSPVAATALGLSVRFQLGAVLAAVVPVALVGSGLYLLASILWCSVVILRANPHVGYAEGWRRTWARVWTPDMAERLLVPAFLMVVVALTVDGFIAFKQSLPRFVEYRWDVALANLDAVLHGRDPWRYTHALPLTAFLDVTYVSWFPIKLLFLVAASLIGPLHLRARVFWANSLLWMLGGVVAAYALASAGPVYYGAFTGDVDRFAPLLDSLRGSHARYLQERLWGALHGEIEWVFAGITAWPSMHVGLSVLMATWGWHVHRTVGIAMSLYALVIFVGSVHLGWHYAVDGYGAALIVAGCWWLAGKAVGIEPAQPDAFRLAGRQGRAP